ncbi:hypothetical protein TorRG33x02_181990, partial [Trema orientale]
DPGMACCASTRPSRVLRVTCAWTARLARTALPCAVARRPRTFYCPLLRLSPPSSGGDGP